MDEAGTDGPTQADIEAFWAEHDRRAPDTVLEAIVHTVTSTGSQQPVILTVGGNLISGTIVDRIAWLDALKETQGTSALESAREDWAKKVQAIRDSELDEDMPPFDSFVHLIDAQWFGGGTGIPESGMCWRGRQSEVQGWALGRLRYGPASTED